MKKVVLFFALIIGLLSSASTMQAQVNMSRYITLTVKSGEAIRLDFKAAAAGTPVRIVSGSNTQDITVGTGWYGRASYTADGTTMTVYGNISSFKCQQNDANLTAIDLSHNTQLTELDCSYNRLTSLDVSNNTQLTTLYCFSNSLTTLDVSKNTQLVGLECSGNQLTALDVSKNTQLKELICSGNKFTTAALDCIYCALPAKISSDSARIFPLKESSSVAQQNMVASTNAANATAKNWRVLKFKYDGNHTDIATTGSYVCSGGGGTTTYALEIAGVQVTSANCSNLSVIDSVSGTVKYDPSTKTLTLQNATISASTNDAAIESNIDGLTIKVIGTNNLTTANRSVLVFTKPLTITGGGVLNVNSGIDYVAIFADRTNLTIDGCTVNAKGKYGISGQDGSSEMLTIKNSTVTAEGASNGCSIADFASLTLDGCAITQPAGAVFSTSLHAVALGGAKVTSKVVISPVTTYDLKIAGVHVTYANCSDLSVIPNVSGTVKYDPATKVLTLQNATISASTNDAAIESNITGLTVKVIGTNNLTATMAFYNTATITGGGTLNVEIQNYSAIYAYRTNLTIDGCTVNAKGKWGIAGDDGSREMLTIKNSTVTAEGASKGSIDAFASLTLDGCAITQPAGAAFDASLNAVALGGAVVTSKVVISPVTTYNLKIAGVQVTSANCSDLSVIPDVSGTVKYDPTNKVLTLDGATIQTTDNTVAINSNIDGLTIKVIGTNNLTTGDNATLYFKEPLTITGGGVLNAKNEKYYGAIFAYKTNLTIDGCTVNAKGKWGITGFNGSSETLTIKNSTVTSEGTDGSIADFASLTLDGCAITQPAGAAFDASLHSVALGGAVVTSKVVISPTEPNMSRYITLTVGSGEAIKLDLKAATNGTPVRIVSGSNTQNITVGIYWYGIATYTADGTEMKVYGDLTNFVCFGNGANLTALDVSHNTQLTELWCHSNLLSSLDISKNRQLNTLYCWDNKFSTQALDDIYCALPVRSASDNAEIVPVESASAPNHATVLATNAQNATAKNWKVLYAEDNADVPTTGKHKCSATDIAEASAEPALTLYPNPVAEVLYLSATARTIRIYDMYGTEVAHATDTDRVEVSHLPAGIYTVKADGMVAKMVKR